MNVRFITYSGFPSMSSVLKWFFFSSLFYALYYSIYIFLFWLFITNFLSILSSMHIYFDLWRAMAWRDFWWSIPGSKILETFVYLKYNFFFLFSSSIKPRNFETFLITSLLSYNLCANYYLNSSFSFLLSETFSYIIAIIES